MYDAIGEYSEILSYLLWGVTICLLVLIGRIRIETKTSKRQNTKSKKELSMSVFLALCIAVYFGYCLYASPNYLFGLKNWSEVQATYSQWVIMFVVIVTGCLFAYLYYINLLFTCTKHKEKNYAAIISLSILNGLMNTLIILTINETFNTGLQYSKELLLFFIFFVLFYVYTQKILQEKLIKNANLLINEKRLVIVDEIMNSTYEKIETIGNSRVYTVLNNDTEVISKSPELIVLGFSNLLTILFCLVYLGYQNIYGFVGSLAIIVLNLVFSMFINKKASKYWIKNREMKDKYFSYTTHLLNGFKELILNKFKKDEYASDMKKCARETTDHNVTASIKILNFGLYNTTMYNIIFAVVVFIFPMVLIGINVDDLRETLFIVFYIVGPFQILINTITQLESLKVNIRQINDLIAALQSKDKSNIVSGIKGEFNLTQTDHIELELKDVEYSYYMKDKDNNVTEFKLGPINTTLKSGEILLLIGGNGSGKSTLSKIITGLYVPQKGAIALNGQVASTEDLNHCFSAIFSDFHIFDKLYGINFKDNEKDFNDLLELMRIKDKVNITENGELNSNELSTGQKKRLAYIITCLENKPLILLDEWAAEQDPEFKAFFYEELLGMLKAQGKGVIVVTHDDQYFHVADRVIKMESGEIQKNYYVTA